MPARRNGRFELTGQRGLWRAEVEQVHGGTSGVVRTGPRRLRKLLTTDDR
jgi:hypothetical protein